MFSYYSVKSEQASPATQGCVKRGDVPSQSRSRSEPFEPSAGLVPVNEGGSAKSPSVPEVCVCVCVCVCMCVLYLCTYVHVPVSEGT